MTPIETLGAAIERALDDAPVADVLSLVTGVFVGLTVELVRRQGHDAAREIKVDGGPNRDITIHAHKAEAPSGLVPVPFPPANWRQVLDAARGRAAGPADTGLVANFLRQIAGTDWSKRELRDLAGAIESGERRVAFDPDLPTLAADGQDC